MTQLRTVVSCKPYRDFNDPLLANAADLAPVGGVVFFAWTIEDVLLLYWAESAVIGFYNLARMWVIGRWKILVVGPFFLVHYSGFMAGHLFFI